MAMKPVSAWPVSTQGMTMHCLAIEPKGDGQGGQKRRAADGLPGWAVSGRIQIPGQEAALIDVTVWQQNPPEIQEFGEFKFVGDRILVRQWANDRGNGGFWYETDGVEPVDSSARSSHGKSEG